MIGVLWLLIGQAGAQPAGGATCLRSEFEAFLGQLRPTNGRIALSVSPKQGQWRVGDAVRIEVTTPFAGRLTLITVDSEGAVFPIFPNAQLRDDDGDWIAAGVPLIIPHPDQDFEVRTAPPLGPSQLVAIVRPKERRLPLECAQALERGKGVTLVDGPRTHRRKLRVNGRRALDGWGLAQLKYEVVPASGE